MVSKKVSLAALMFMMTCTSMQPAPVVSGVKNYIQKNKKEAMMVALAALLARPAYDLASQLMKKSDKTPYSLLSLFGYKCGVKPKNKKYKEEQFRGQLSLGSADVTVKTPVNLKSIEKMLKELNPSSVAHKRSVDDFLSFLNDFYPKLLIAIEDQTSPVVRDKEAEVDATVKRLFAKFSCGKFEFRTGVDLSEAIIIPGSMVGAYVLHMLNEYYKSKKAA